MKDPWQVTQSSSLRHMPFRKLSPNTDAVRISSCFEKMNHINAIYCWRNQSRKKQNAPAFQGDSSNVEVALR